MPKRSKSKLTRVKGSKKKSKNKLLNPTPSHNEVLTGMNRINQQHITSEKQVLLNVNPMESRTEIQTLLPVENQTTFEEVAKTIIIRAPDNATAIKHTSEVEIQNKSSTISKRDTSESNLINYKVLKLEDMINLWNELSKIAVPQCRCTNLKMKK